MLEEKERRGEEEGKGLILCVLEEMGVDAVLVRGKGEADLSRLSASL